MSANTTAPPLRAPRVSILSSAEIINQPESDGHAHWQDGINLYPLSAKNATGVFPVCPTAEELSEKYTICEQMYTPFVVYATDVATSFQTKDIDLVGRAKDKLAVMESYWIERELWEDTQALGNPSFTGTPNATEVVTDTTPLRGFVELDQAVAEDPHDGRGMIHMTVDVFGFLQDYNLFRREGNVWLSPLDNIVVPGRGYTGNGPNSQAATSSIKWMFGHPGVVQIARSNVMVLPEEDQILKSMERTVGDVWVSAQRVVGLVVSNGVDESGADPVTGFYAASVSISGEGVTQTKITDDTGYASATVYRGYTLYNDSGADATIIFYEGSDNTGAILDVVNLVDGESAREWYDPGIQTEGIYVDITAGTINANSTIRYQA